MHANQSTHGKDEVLLGRCHLSRDHRTDGWHVEDWHDGIDVFVVEVNTLRNKVQEGSVQRLMLVGCEDAPWFWPIARI